MKNFIRNIGYFLKEAKTMIKLNLMSNIFSLVSTGLIFFFLAMVVSGWWVSSQVVEVIQGEAEINVYLEEGIDDEGALLVIEKINEIKGVEEARMVDEGEAYDRMVEILGEEAQVLESFDENPFSAFIEVKIHLEEINTVLEKIFLVTGIQHIRDNREVLDRISNLAGILKVIGYLVVTAVGISTLVIISHIIRQGIYNNKDQINTLRLLGAPESFIAFPFLLEGLLLTLGGGILAVVLSVFSLKYFYVQMTGPLPFIPLPPIGTLTPALILLIITLSGALGIVGSLLGLSSAEGN